jgi:ABC-type phosphate transport system substrate-binding protein
MTRIVLILSLLWAFGFSSGIAPVASGSPEPLAVIVHPGVSAEALSGPDLRSIYRRETRFWPSGEAIRPLALPPESDLRQQFDLAVMGLDADGVARFWIDQRVRGTATPPRVVPSTALIARVVPALSGSIAYVPLSMAPKGARVVAMVRDGRVQTALASQRHLAQASAEAP